MDNFHIVETNGVWQLKAEGSDKAIKEARTKQDILEQTQSYMSDRVASVKVHKRDGEIEEERTYPRAADPRKSKG